MATSTGIASTTKKGRSGGGYLYVPASLMKLVPKNARFRCELNEDGVLFRRVTEEDLPSWATPEITPE